MTRRLAIYVAVLAVLVVYFLIWPVWRAQFLIEIWPTEAWNAYFQDAAAFGGRLYPPADALIGNNYDRLSRPAVRRQSVCRTRGFDCRTAGSDR